MRFSITIRNYNRNFVSCLTLRRMPTTSGFQLGEHLHHVLHVGDIVDLNREPSMKRWRNHWTLACVCLHCGLDGRNRSQRNIAACLRRRLKMWIVNPRSTVQTLVHRLKNVSMVVIFVRCGGGYQAEDDGRSLVRVLRRLHQREILDDDEERHD